MPCNRSLVLLLTFLVAFAACKKHDSGSPNSAQSVDIYVLGTSNNSLIYWKNGQPTQLTGTGGLQAYGTGIAISGNNVYASGGSTANQVVQ